MAGDWIKMRTNLNSDPRVIRIAGELGIPELHVVGCLWMVWSWADQHTVDGNAICVTDVTLDRFTSVTGFANALRNAGWLTGENGAISFPNFVEHNGKTAKNRAETNKRVAKHRNAKTVTDVTQKPLPEKRREEKSNKRVSRKTERLSIRFSDWYAKYPRKVARAAAESAYDKAVLKICADESCDIPAAEEMLMNWTEERLAGLNKMELAYVPHPASWLNGERYRDQIDFGPVQKKCRPLTREEIENYVPTEL